MQTGQRPKLEPVPGGRRPAAAPLPDRAHARSSSQERLESEQISMFLERELVITIQESPGDIWDPIRARIEKPGSRLRELDASFLAYALIDAIVDHCFPVLEHYGDRLEELEDLVLDQPTRDTINDIHAVKRELLLLRRAVWPMREVVNDDAARAARVHERDDAHLPARRLRPRHPDHGHHRDLPRGRLEPDRDLHDVHVQPA